MMKSNYYILILILFSSTLTFAQKKIALDSVYTIQDSVMIPTKSGINICAVIVRKKGNSQPLPSILFYTTYYQGKGDTLFGKKSADHDYVGIIAYARGIRTDLRYYAPFENEGNDIYDIIEWISKQSWCNGSVGMYGGSYTGFAQWAATKKLHPALKTIVPQVAVMPGFDFPMENNVQMNATLYWPNDNIYKNQQIKRSLPFEWFKQGLSFRSLDSLSGIESPIFKKWINHPAYDFYWQSVVPTPEEYGKINIPILTTTGYYDGSQIGAIQYFKQHTFYNKNADHYLVIGPYDHWGGQRYPSKNLMGYKIDSVANVSMSELAYDWLDYILKGKQKPEILQDKVNYEVMGANEWRHVSNLDAMSNDSITMYLSSEKSAGNYKLNTLEPGMDYVSQKIDFTDRTTENNFYTPDIIFDSLDAGNGLIFKSGIFNQEFEISGSFTGHLFATINKKDMDISCALYEQKSDQTYFFLTRYIGRASYAKDNYERQLLTPGRKESILFYNTRIVSKIIERGSRLVILLNVNKHPFEIINYGSGKEVADETIHDAGAPLEIKWHTDSYIQIPIFRDWRPKKNFER